MSQVIFENKGREISAEFNDQGVSSKINASGNPEHVVRLDGVEIDGKKIGTVPRLVRNKIAGAISRELGGIQVKLILGDHHLEPAKIVRGIPATVMAQIALREKLKTTTLEDIIQDRLPGSF